MTRCCAAPVRSARLWTCALAPEHQRWNGALYAGLNRGRIDVARLRRALLGVPLPRADDGRPMPAVDASPWLRLDVNTCSDRSFCHTFGGHTAGSPVSARAVVAAGLPARDATVIPTELPAASPVVSGNRGGGIHRSGSSTGSTWSLSTTRRAACPSVQCS
ncbi:transposase [Streptomyces sp. NPDC001549]|uniref:transposase n=1 Tax=Streptomyces sp. NPDC001549 TaxID=3364586 RepID=UPI00369724E6